MKRYEINEANDIKSIVNEFRRKAGDSLQAKKVVDAMVEDTGTDWEQILSVLLKSYKKMKK